MNGLEKRIMRTLLEKYERSKAYADQTDGSRRVLLKITPGSLKTLKLDLEDFEDKQAFHEAVEHLKSLELIAYSWIKFEENNLLKEVWLNVEQMRLAYDYLGETPKISLNDEVIASLRSLAFEHYSWMASFQSDILRRYESTHQWTPFLPKEPEMAKSILQLLSYLDSLKGEPIYERVLSNKLYKDSKYFGKHLKSKFFTLVKRYGSPVDESGLSISTETLECERLDYSELEDDELLEAFGILKHPELLEFCGPILLETQWAAIDCRQFPLGMVVNMHTASSIQGVMNKGVRQVTFIENKANYESYVANDKAPDELVVYHGGMYSPGKGMFFKRLIDGLGTSECLYRHWSDIDLGGFRIFERLKRNICPTLEAYRMDISTLKNHQEHWILMEDPYEVHLSKLLDQKAFEPFNPVIRFMLDHHCRLEQESLIL